MEAQEDRELFMSVVALAEIRDGIEELRSKDPRQATQFEIWLREIESHFGSRVLPVTTAIADRWGRLNRP
jgi:toxin FitB